MIEATACMDQVNHFELIHRLQQLQLQLTDATPPSIAPRASTVQASQSPPLSSSPLPQGNNSMAWEEFHKWGSRIRASGDYANKHNLIFPIVIAMRSWWDNLNSPMDLISVLVLTSMFFSTALWSKFHVSSYSQVRTPIVACLRMAFFTLTPFHRLIRSVLFLPGQGTQSLSPAVLVLPYIVAIQALPLLGLSLSRRLSTLFHVLVQSVSVAAVMSQNGQVCSLFLQYPGSKIVLDTFDSMFGMFATVLPMPLGLLVLDKSRTSPQTQCMCVSGLLQVLFGFIVPTAIILMFEVREVASFSRRAGPVPDKLKIQKSLFKAYLTVHRMTAVTLLFISLMALSATWLIFVLYYVI